MNVLASMPYFVRLALLVALGALTYWWDTHAGATYGSLAMYAALAAFSVVGGAIWFWPQRRSGTGT